MLVYGFEACFNKKSLKIVIVIPIFIFENFFENMFKALKITKFFLPELVIIGQKFFLMKIMF